MDWLSIGKWIAGIVAVIVTAGIVIKVVVSTRNSKSKSTRFVSQKNNRAGGDIIAGDSMKKNSK